jgi:hypothetical protein
LNTVTNAATVVFQPPPLPDSVGSSLGSMKNSSTPISNPPTPIAAQKTFHPSPRPMSGPTTNCPAEPPAMPNICVAPISVAARDGAKFRVAM